MSMWGSIAAGLQDNGGVGLSDPYSDTSNTTSSFSSLASQLVSAAANVGESYAVSKSAGGTIVPTGNPLAPTAVIPTPQQSLAAAQANALAMTPKLVEYGLVALLALVGAVLIFKK